MKHGQCEPPIFVAIISQVAGLKEKLGIAMNQPLKDYLKDIDGFEAQIIQYQVSFFFSRNLTKSNTQHCDAEEQ